MKKKILVAGLLIILTSCRRMPQDVSLETLDPMEEEYEEERKDIIKKLSFRDEMEFPVFGIPDNPLNLNPMTYSDEASSIIVHTLYRNLFEIRNNGIDTVLEMDLLKEFKNIDDERFILQLKNDLKWDDGQDLTVDDIIYSIEYTYDHRTNYQDNFIVHGKKPILNKIDDHKMEILLDEPSTSFVYYLRDLLPIPKHIFLENNKRSYGLEKEFLVGNSSYKYYEEVFDTDFGTNRIIFKINPHYELEKPDFERMDYRVTGYSETDTSRYDMEAYNINGGYIESYDPGAFTNEFYNVYPTEGKLISLLFKTNTKNGGDPEIRKALATMITPSYIQGNYGSDTYVARANSLFTPNNPYRFREGVFRSTDPGEGIRALKKMQMGNPDFKLRFGFILDIGKPDEKAAITLQETFRNLGVNLEVIPLFREEFYAILRDPHQDVFDFCLFEMDAEDNPYEYRHLFRKDDPRNYSGFEDEELMAMWEQADQMRDKDERMKAYGKIQERILDDHVIVPMTYTLKPLVLDERFFNVEEAIPDNHSFVKYFEKLKFEEEIITDEMKKEYEIKDKDLEKERPYDNVNIKDLDKIED
ncbi:MAG: ABC transporter substrate-binding protein [Tissierellia bacterium]|nr:ABC transporter substrate-binding protein [Tissierellia bacterium]